MCNSSVTWSVINQVLTRIIAYPRCKQSWSNRLKSTLCSSVWTRCDLMEVLNKGLLQSQWINPGSLSFYSLFLELPMDLCPKFFINRRLLFDREYSHEPTWPLFTIPVIKTFKVRGGCLFFVHVACKYSLLFMLSGVVLLLLLNPWLLHFKVISWLFSMER